MKASQWYGVVLICYVLLKSTGMFDGGSGGGGIFKTPLVDPWLVIVEQSEDRPAYLSNLATDAGLWEQASALGVRHRFIDVDSPDAESYRSKANEIGLPAYLLFSGGKLLNSGKVPESREGVMKVLNQEG